MTIVVASESAVHVPSLLIHSLLHHTSHGGPSKRGGPHFAATTGTLLAEGRADGTVETVMSILHSASQAVEIVMTLGEYGTPNNTEKPL